MFIKHTIQKLSPIRENKKGSALLLAMIVMSALIVAGIILGNLTINEIRQARQLDYAITAYYAAESGAEKLLYDWRTTLNTSVFDGDCVQGDLSQLGWVCSQRVDSLTELSFYLPQLKVEEVPLYQPGDLSQASGIDTAVINWSDYYPENLVEPWLEVTLIEWPAGSSVDFANNQNIIKKAYRCSAATATSSVCDTITITDFSPANSYILRLRAVYDDIKKITIKFYDGSSPTPMDFNDYVRIADFTGIYRGVKQGVRVRFPIIEPSSSLFDYVIFSEDSLTKTIF